MAGSSLTWHRQRKVTRNAREDCISKMWISWQLHKCHPNVSKNAVAPHLAVHFLLPHQLFLLALEFTRLEKQIVPIRNTSRNLRIHLTMKLKGFLSKIKSKHGLESETSSCHFFYPESMFRLPFWISVSFFKAISKIGGWKLKASGPTTPPPVSQQVLHISRATRQLLRETPCKRRLANDEGTYVDNIPLRKRRIWETLSGQHSFVGAGLIKSKNKHSWKIGPKTSQDMPVMRFWRQASVIFLSTVSPAPVACSAASSLAIMRRNPKSKQQTWERLMFFICYVGTLVLSRKETEIKIQAQITMQVCYL